MSVFRHTTRVRLPPGLAFAPSSRRTFFPLPDLSKLDPFSGSGLTSRPQSYHERKILPYSQRQLWDLVADVDSYRYFIPFCKGSKVLTPAPPILLQGKPYTVNAELTVGFLAFEESYVSTVTCTPFQTVEATGKSNIFKALTTTWRVQPASPESHHPSSGTPSSTSCRDNSADSDKSPALLTIDLSYEFASPLHAGVAAKVFDQVSGMMVSAFEKRCLDVYGPGSR